MRHRSGAERREEELQRASSTTIRRMHRLLHAAYGPQHWWPAETPTEVVIGAILTQNTAWRNVERAIANLRRAECLSFPALHARSADALAALIRPAGTFRVKARRLKSFVEELFAHYDGHLDVLLDGTLAEARRRLLRISGVGPETADAILLYAGQRPSFVVDAYTTRILRRHFLIDERATYAQTRDLFLRALPEDVQLFNEYHALLVEVGKRHCRPRALCEGCPLAHLRHDGGL